MIPGYQGACSGAAVEVRPVGSLCSWKGWLGLVARVHFTALIRPASWFLCFYSCLWIRKGSIAPLATVLVPSSFFVFNRDQKLSAIIFEDALRFHANSSVFHCIT